VQAITGGGPKNNAAPKIGANGAYNWGDNNDPLKG